MAAKKGIRKSSAVQAGKKPLAQSQPYQYPRMQANASPAKDAPHSHPSHRHHGKEPESKILKKDFESNMPVNYAGLAILFNMVGLGALFSKRWDPSGILIVQMLFIGNLMMVIGFFYIMKRARIYGENKI